MEEAAFQGVFKQGEGFVSGPRSSDSWLCFQASSGEVAKPRLWKYKCLATMGAGGGYVSELIMNSGQNLMPQDNSHFHYFREFLK